MGRGAAQVLEVGLGCVGEGKRACKRIMKLRTEAGSSKAKGLCSLQPSNLAILLPRV